MTGKGARSALQGAVVILWFVLRGPWFMLA